MSQPRPAVVELFTSEGCSSCPPAEAYVGELAQRHDVLALTFHVDYWDNLGWPDRFALASATQRQRDYAKALARASVYTPQAVIDGRADFVGSDRRAIAAALVDAREGIPIGLAAVDGKITITLGERHGAGESEVILIGYQRKATSRISRGENSGRTLEEFNIVRSFRTVGVWDGEASQFQAHVDSLPRDVTDIAVLVQPRGAAPILGAAKLPLAVKPTQ
jgi:hypothetical protein